MMIKRNEVFQVMFGVQEDFGSRNFEFLDCTSREISSVFPNSNNIFVSVGVL
jgi:hypothetical protein